MINFMASDSVSTALRRISQNIALTESGLLRLKYHTQQTMFLMRRAVESTTIALGLLGVSLGAMYKKIVDNNIEIEKMTTLISSISGKSFEEVDKSITKISLQLPNTTTEVAKLQYEISKLGATGITLDTVTKKALELGNVFNEDSVTMGRIIFVASKMTKEFDKLTPKQKENILSKITDEIAKSFSMSAENLQKLRYSLQNAQGTFQTLGFSFEDLLTTSTLVAKYSELTPTRLGSGLNIFARALAYSKDKLEKLGINVYNSNGKLLDMSTILKKIGKAQLSLSQIREIFGADGATVVNTLIQHYNEFDDVMSELSNSMGTTSKMTEEYAKTTGYQLGIFKSRMEIFSKAIYQGTSDIRANILKSINDIINKLVWYDEKQDKIMKSTTTQFIINGFNELLKVIKGFVEFSSNAFDDLNSFLQKHEDEIRLWYFNFKNLLISLKNTFVIVFNIIKSIIVNSGLLNLFRLIAINGVKYLQEKIEELNKKLSELKNIFDNSKPIIDEWKNKLSDKLDDIIKKFKDLKKQIEDVVNNKLNLNIKSNIENILEKYKELLETIKKINKENAVVLDPNKTIREYDDKGNVRIYENLGGMKKGNLLYEGSKDNVKEDQGKIILNDVDYKKSLIKQQIETSFTEPIKLQWEKIKKFISKDDYLPLKLTIAGILTYVAYKFGGDLVKSFMSVEKAWKILTVSAIYPLLIPIEFAIKSIKNTFIGISDILTYIKTGSLPKRDVEFTIRKPINKEDYNKRITQLEKELEKLNDKKVKLNENKIEYLEELDVLNERKTQLENEINLLKDSKNELNIITTAEEKINHLKKSGVDLTISQISSYKNLELQINTLQNTINKLKKEELKNQMELKNTQELLNNLKTKSLTPNEKLNILIKEQFKNIKKYKSELDDINKRILPEIDNKLKNFNKLYENPLIAQYTLNEAKIEYLKSLIKTEIDYASAAEEKGINVNNAAKIKYLEEQINKLKQDNVKLTEKLGILNKPDLKKIFGTSMPEYKKLLREKVKAELKKEELKIKIDKAQYKIKELKEKPFKEIEKEIFKLEEKSKKLEEKLSKLSESIMNKSKKLDLLKEKFNKLPLEYIDKKINKLSKSLEITSNKIELLTTKLNKLSKSLKSSDEIKNLTNELKKLKLLKTPKVEKLTNLNLLEKGIVKTFEYISDFVYKGLDLVLIKTFGYDFSKYEEPLKTKFYSLAKKSVGLKLPKTPEPIDFFGKVITRTPVAITKSLFDDIKTPSIISKLSPIFTKIINSVIKIFSKLEKGLRFLKKFGSPLLKFAIDTERGASVLTKLGRVFGTLLKALGTFTIILDIIFVAIETVKLAMYSWKTDLYGFSTALKNSFDMLNGSGSGLLNGLLALGNVFDIIYKTIANFIIGFASLVIPVISGVISSVGNIINAIVDSISYIFNILFGGFKTNIKWIEKFSKILGYLGSTFGFIIGILGKVLGTGIRLLSWFIGGLVELSKWIGGIIYRLLMGTKTGRIFINIIKSLLNKIKNFGIYLYKNFKWIYKNWDTIIERFAVGLINIKKSIMDFLDSIMGKFGINKFKYTKKEYEADVRNIKSVLGIDKKESVIEKPQENTNISEENLNNTIPKLDDIKLTMNENNMINTNMLTNLSSVNVNTKQTNTSIPTLIKHLNTITKFTKSQQSTNKTVSKTLNSIKDNTKIMINKLSGLKKQVDKNKSDIIYLKDKISNLSHRHHVSPITGTTTHITDASNTSIINDHKKVNINITTASREDVLSIIGDYTL